MVLGFLRAGLGTEATVLTLCIGAEVLVGDSKGSLLDVELETSSPRGCCGRTTETGVRSFPDIQIGQALEQVSSMSKSVPEQSFPRLESIRTP